MINEVVDIIVSVLGCDPESVTSSARLVEDLGADSLDIPEITIWIEDDLNIELPIDGQDFPITVGELMEMVKNAQ